MENDEDIIVVDIHVSETVKALNKAIYCFIDNVPEPYSSTLESYEGCFMYHTNDDSSIFGTTINLAVANADVVGAIYTKFETSSRLPDIQSICFTTHSASNPNLEYVSPSDFKISGKLYLLKQPISS